MFDSKKKSYGHITRDIVTLLSSDYIKHSTTNSVKKSSVDCLNIKMVSLDLHVFNILHFQGGLTCLKEFEATT